MTERVLVPVRNKLDVVAARKSGRALAAQLGFGATEQTLLAAAISELARNILGFAGEGEIVLGSVSLDGRAGIEIVARDRGPGITDVEAALRDGFSTGGGLGIGLPGARRLVHELSLESAPGAGTVVTLRRWLPA